MKKVVLAYSGGLDTSYCAKHLSADLGYEVHGVTVNTGSFTEDELQQVSRKAKLLGVTDYQVIDETQRYYDQGVKYLLFGNVLKNNTYPLSVSAERVFQAIAIAQYAKKIDADAIAHGSTGAGNDQIRFDMIFHAICPDKEIITPIRDNTLTREEEISYLQSHGVEGDWEKAAYSINQGLWGTSVGGKETLTSDQFLPEEAFPFEVTKQEPSKIKLSFKKGEAVELDGKQYAPIDLINELNTIANRYGIGRDIHVGDTIIGIKGRVGFVAAATLILIKAHHLLEKHVLTKQQLQIKDQLAYTYGNLVHEGQFLDPAMRDIEQFLESSQQHVSGEVEVLLAPYRFQVLGVSSPNDLMQTGFGSYGEINKGWTAQDARGFAKIFGNQTRIYRSLHNDE